MEFDVVDLRAFRTADTGGAECLANLPGEMDELVKVRFCNRVGMMFDQKKPVAAPGNIAGHGAVAWHFDLNRRTPAVAGYVFEGYGTVLIERDSHNAYRRFHAMRTGLDSAQICERGYDTDGSMPAHAQASAVVEKNNACDAIGTGGLAEQCAHHRFGGTRLGDKSAAEGFVIVLEQKATLLQVALAEVRAAFDDGSGRLAAGV